MDIFICRIYNVAKDVCRKAEICGDGVHSVVTRRSLRATMVTLVLKLSIKIRLSLCRSVPVTSAVCSYRIGLK